MELLPLENLKGAGTDTSNRDFENALAIRAHPVAMVPAIDNFNGEDRGESTLEPYVGLEFDSADGAREFYGLYAGRLGFKVRIGQLYRSRTDGSVSSRRFVCSKEGFQLNSRTGCPALIRVQRRDSGKWIIDLFLKDHNHKLGLTEESNPTLQQKVSSKMNSVNVSPRPRINLDEIVEEGQPCSSGVINVKCLKRNGGDMQSKVEPFAGLEFNSANEAYQFYGAYAASAGFKTRIGQLFRSKVDGSITSRRFVCTKEGFQHPSRVGCGAFMRIKRQDSGRWIVDRLKKDHNHELEHHLHKKSLMVSKMLQEDENEGPVDECIFSKNNEKLVGRNRENHISKKWYSVLLDYFQTRQAEDTGFFYAVEVDNGCCMSIFWADGRSRFLSSQFGDAIIVDTSYRKSIYLVPFATFIGINHHKQPVLLGCALVADESSYVWLFQTWFRVMAGRHPLSIIADQDKGIQQAIKRVFPGTHHRFSLWQIKAKERENLNLMDGVFMYEYEKCIYQSQTTDEFDSAWSMLLTKYGLSGNAWLNEMYENRENWVSVYLRGTFFAGILLNGSTESFFGALLNAHTPLVEFVSWYERGIERRREEERKEDFNSFNSQFLLQTKEAIEEQCRTLYTHTIFKIFQKELLQSYGYLGFKIYEERDTTRYLLRKGGNDNEKCIVTFCASNLNVGCSCQMFEFEGVLCRHALRVFQIMNVSEIPSRYILHRWTKNAEYGTIRDLESGGNPQELKTLMLWSLREASAKYIEAGAACIENYKVAYEVMLEGGRKLCWQK